MTDISQPFSIGIDLGTTHCAIAVRTSPTDAAELLPIPQFIEIGQVNAHTLLPSFGLQPDETSRDKLSNGLPWGTQHGLVVGEFARSQAYKQPGRVITSSKSWLSHAEVDRTENILPWDADEGVAQCSPVVAASMYLSQLRRAFEHAYPEAGKLSDHNVVLTVPASFDPVARELTLRAAELSGVGVPRLLEEPQSALYSWLSERGNQWREELTAGDLVLVCDVGGGTTDFSLISIVDNDGNLELERIAVGDHILLGGDNMDLTLAFVVRQKLQREKGISLDRWQFKALTQACRIGKELLFSDDALDS
ncbi:MAG: Hsp70 family protein, partial [Bradymonadia bacterium]